jgi:nucleoid-associated protein Lsr2
VATRVQYTVVDDLDGSTDGVGTYRFALEGVEYEIDLSETNLGTLRDALAPYIAAGRRQARSRTTGRRGSNRSADAAVRDWWATHQQRLDLPTHRTHGPIPPTVREAYRAAH